MPVLAHASNGTPRTLDDETALVPVQERVGETDQQDIINPAVQQTREVLSQLGMSGVIRGHEHNLQKAVSDEFQRDRRHTIASLTAAVLGVLVAVVRDRSSYP